MLRDIAHTQRLRHRLVSVTGSRMPASFIGHGNPMNAIEENVYMKVWSQMAQSFLRPKAILAGSAQRYLPWTVATAMEAPRTIHDLRRIVECPRWPS
jgi:aromatic ring-opening dioxygenase catalytic subunit (LigB family)